MYRFSVSKFWVSLLAIVVVSVLYNRFPLHRKRYQSSSYIISGSFTSSSLYLLRYDREKGHLELVYSIQGYGPHQYLYLDQSHRRLYATSWSEPPHISAWSIEFQEAEGHPKLAFLNKTAITAVSSYITSKHGLLFSVGGPTGEIHQLNPTTGAIERKIQELLFVPQQYLADEDKSRKALRSGSHGIEISSLDQVFVPHLGHNSIWIYQYDPRRKMLELLNEVQSIQLGDAPRHAVVSKDGRRLYVITEHASRVDVYNVGPNKIVHEASSSVIDDPNQKSNYRGDTIRILPNFPSNSPTNTEYIFATTRATNTSSRGLLAVFEFDLKTRTLRNLIRWETPTSGGKSNAIEFGQLQNGRKKVELVLTDDEVGWVSILEYDLSKNTITLISRCLIDQEGIGASHAVWIQ